MTSFVRPAKLFTANSSLIVTEAGVLHGDVLERIVAAIVELFQGR